MSIFYINTNNLSIQAINRFEQTEVEQKKTLERIASGKRINSSADDAAGLAIAKRMNTRNIGIRKAIENLQTGINYVQTTEGALTEITEILQRLRVLTLQSVNDTLVKGDREKIQKEINQLLDEIDKIANQTHFNNKYPLQIATERLAELPKSPVGRADISIMVDGSSSMVPYIANVKANIVNFINDLKTRGIDFRISVTVLGATAAYDNVDWTKTILDSSSNDTDIVNAVNSIVAVAGATVDPYNSLLEVSGIADTAGAVEPDKVTLRNNTKYFQVLVTDTIPEGQVGTLTGYPIYPVNPPGDPPFTPAGPLTFYANSDRELATANALTQNKDITVFAVVPLVANNNPYYDDIINQTGGKFFDIMSGTFGQEMANLSYSISDLSGTDEPCIPIDNGAFKIQSGLEEGDIFNIDRYHINYNNLGLSHLDVAKDDADYDKMLRSVTLAINAITTIRTNLGASQNVMESKLDRLEVASENLVNSKSRIEDVDVAKETANLVSSQIKAEAGTAILAQANISPFMVLKLLE